MIKYILHFIHYIGENINKSTVDPTVAIKREISLSFSLRVFESRQCPFLIFISKYILNSVNFYFNSTLSSKKYLVSLCLNIMTTVIV